MSGQYPVDDAELSIVGHRHYGRWLSALVVLLIVGVIVNSMLHNPRFEWSVVAENLTEASILNGVLMTLKLTVISVVFGFAGGVLLALMRLSANPVLVAVSWFYTAGRFERDRPAVIFLRQPLPLEIGQIAAHGIDRNADGAGQFRHRRLPAFAEQIQ